MSRRTPLHERHLAAGARMVEFGGHLMPLQYSNVRLEHLAVRERVGLFDLSHMGEVTLRGRGAPEALRRLCASDTGRLEEGQAQYGLMCNDSGGIVDDVIVYRDAGAFMIVVNAACREKDVAWMRRRAPDGVEVVDDSDGLALLAVQGPRSAELLQQLTDADLDGLRPFHCLAAPVAGVVARVSRTGYTGEDGFELYTTAGEAVTLWDALLGVGGPEAPLPAGLAARDTLRLEAGLRLYGQDMDESVDPFSCGLGWTVRADQRDFIGAAALERIDPRHPPRRFIGLSLPARAIPRHGNRVLAAGRPAGEVTSGGFSFSLGHGIATALVQPEPEPDHLSVDIRGREIPARRTALPFYRREGDRSRA